MCIDHVARGVQPRLPLRDRATDEGHETVSQRQRQMLRAGQAARCCGQGRRSRCYAMGHTERNAANALAAARWQQSSSPVASAIIPASVSYRPTASAHAGRPSQPDFLCKAISISIYTY